MNRRIEILPPVRCGSLAAAGVRPTTSEGALSSPPLDRLVPMKEVLAAVPYSRTTIYRMVIAGTFPAPIKIGKARIAWRASSLRQWLADKAIAA